MHKKINFFYYDRNINKQREEKKTFEKPRTFE